MRQAFKASPLSYFVEILQSNVLQDTDSNYAHLVIQRLFEHSTQYRSRIWRVPYIVIILSVMFVIVLLCGNVDFDLSIVKLPGSKLLLSKCFEDIYVFIYCII